MTSLATGVPLAQHDTGPPAVAARSSASEALDHDGFCFSLDEGVLAHALDSERGQAGRT